MHRANPAAQRLLCSVPQNILQSGTRIAGRPFSFGSILLGRRTERNQRRRSTSSRTQIRPSFVSQGLPLSKFCLTIRTSCSDGNDKEPLLSSPLHRRQSMPRFFPSSKKLETVSKSRLMMNSCTILLVHSKEATHLRTGSAESLSLCAKSL